MFWVTGPCKLLGVARWCRHMYFPSWKSIKPQVRTHLESALPFPFTSFSLRFLGDRTFPWGRSKSWRVMSYSRALGSETKPLGPLPGPTISFVSLLGRTKTSVPALLASQDFYNWMRWHFHEWHKSYKMLYLCRVSLHFNDKLDFW
jgi:hypothetical protein